MKEVRKEILTEQIVYEITKEELEEIKRNERTNGRYDIVGYLSFAMKNYIYEINLGGMMSLIKEIIKFLNDETNTISNTYGYSLNNYIRRYR